MSKEQFISIYNENIKREGADKLLEWLLKSDFFEAPASTKYHLSENGGLCIHSINVYNRFKEEVKEIDVSPETIAICGLLHDVCKANYYKVDFKNAKNENGVWEKVPYYTVDDTFPYGHGEKSVFIISNFIKLSRNEILAIRWHMGGYDDSAKGGSSTLSAAFSVSPIALLLHIADMKASYLDERRTNESQKTTL